MTADQQCRTDRGRPFARRHQRTLVGVLIFAACYLLFFVHRGWIPSDEGLLAHSAERVLAGELPHRDFGDMYTGGQSFLHALALRLLGIKLTSLRWLLYTATLVSLPFVYLIAARVTPPAGAALVTLASVVWTVPNYFASMPSWYNLFLSLGALLAVLRHVESGHNGWLFVAGLLTGLSFLVKSSALLLIAAIFLFLVYREQRLDAAVAEAAAAPAGVARGWSVFVTIGLAMFSAQLIRFVSLTGETAEYVFFVGPSACLCVVLIVDAWRNPGSRFELRFKRLVGLTVPYVSGLFVPAVVFVLPYLFAGGVESLLAGDYLFVVKRLQFSIYALPRVETAIFALPVLGLMAWPVWRPFSPVLERRLVLPLALLLVLAVSLGTNLFAYQSIWFSARPLPLVISFVGSVFLLRDPAWLDSKRRQSLFLVLAVSSVVSVTQFPYSRGIYLCYVAPLVILAALYLVRAQRGAPQTLHLVFLGMYTVFAALWLNLGWVEAFELKFYRPELDTPLAVERGGLHLNAGEAETYQNLVEVIQRLSAEGSYIYATPDSPEVYFLSGRLNPGRSFYDYFEDDFGRPERTARLLQMLEEHSVEVVVLNWQPNFSGPPKDLAATIVEQFPNQVAIPPRFTIHYRTVADRNGSH